MRSKGTAKAEITDDQQCELVMGGLVGTGSCIVRRVTEIQSNEIRWDVGRFGVREA